MKNTNKENNMDTLVQVLENHFYISSGKTNAMYTLRYKYSVLISRRYEEQNHHETDEYIKTLSTDFEQAKAKALSYVAKFNQDKQDPIPLKGGQIELRDIVRRDAEIIAQEKAEQLAREEFWAKVNAERNNNFVYACWGTYMANSCKKFGVKQQGALDTSKRVTLVGTIKSIKEYENTFSYYESYVYKSLIELDSGHKVFGSLPNADTDLDVGDRIKFDAKLEEPKDCDETFYYYKRPTKVQLLDQVKEVA